jgi:hypothetical protein
LRVPGECKFCKFHKCVNADCTNNSYCNIHTCVSSYDCTNAPLPLSNHCGDHSCVTVGCTNGNRCGVHVCHFGCCLRAKNAGPNSRFCEKHECQTIGCTNMVKRYGGTDSTSKICENCDMKQCGIYLMQLLKDNGISMLIVVNMLFLMLFAWFILRVA